MATTKTTFNILFYLRLERKNKNGAPLMMRVTINGRSAKTALGIRVHQRTGTLKDLDVALESIQRVNESTSSLRM